MIWPFNKKKEEERAIDPSAPASLEEIGYRITSSGQIVTPSSAQGLPAVYCAITVLAEAVASLPIHVYRLADEVKERDRNHRVDYLLNVQPNTYQTPAVFIETIYRHVLLRGNGYALIEYDAAGRVKSLHNLHPDRVAVKTKNDRIIGYTVTDQHGRQVPYLPDEILHIRYHSDDGLVGKSPVTVCREAVGAGLAQQEHGGSLFKNGVKPSGVIEFEHFLDSDRGKKFKKSLNDNHTGSRKAGSALVLEGGAKWRGVSLSNSDAQWIEARNFTVADVARIFNVSPIFLHDLTRSTYSNHTEAARSFMTTSLRPHLTRLQQELRRSLIAPRNMATTFIEFQTADVLRGTTDERYSVYEKGIKMGILCPNEARKKENMAPYDGGNEFSQAWKQTVEVKKGGGSNESDGDN